MPENTANAVDTSAVVEEQQGDLFEAPEDAVLIHACNCVGSWGAGIAKAFKTRVRVDPLVQSDPSISGRHEDLYNVSLCRSHGCSVIQYPAAHNVHHDHCKTTAADGLIGTCQLIAPQTEDYERAVADSRPPPSKRRRVKKPIDETSGAHAPAASRRHWIACLFTSQGYGKPTKTHAGMDKPEVILANTRKSLMDLKDQLLKLEQDGREGKGELDAKAGKREREDLPGELWSCKFNSGLFAVDWADTKKILEEELKGLGKTVCVVSPAES